MCHTERIRAAGLSLRDAAIRRSADDTVVARWDREVDPQPRPSLSEPQPFPVKAATVSCQSRDRKGSLCRFDGMDGSPASARWFQRAADLKFARRRERRAYCTSKQVGPCRSRGGHPPAPLFHAREKRVVGAGSAPAGAGVTGRCVIGRSPVYPPPRSASYNGVTRRPRRAMGGFHEPGPPTHGEQHEWQQNP